MQRSLLTSLLPHVWRLSAGLLLAFSHTANAEETLDKQSPSVFFNISAGYSIYKSELIESNDTSTTIGYGFGVYAGQDRNLGLSLQREQSTFAFTLVESSIAVSWQDVVMRYRFGYFYAGLVLAQSNWLINVTPQDDTGEATGDSQEYFAVQASGYGGNFGIQIPVSARSLLYIDTVYSSQPTAQIQARATDHPGDIAAPEEVVLGSRMSVDIGGSLDITRNLIDGVAGFKYRTYSLAVDSTSYIEQHHTTYLGLRFGWTF